MSIGEQKVKEVFKATTERVTNWEGKKLFDEKILTEGSLSRRAIDVH